MGYNRNFGAWSVGGNYSYYQNVQTLLATYTSSSMTYTGFARRKLPKGINWNIGGGRGRSGFTQVAGSESHSENINSSLNWRGYSLGANYSKSAGTSVLTAQGLVTQPVPIAIPNDVVLFNGEGYGVGIGASPVPNMTIGVSYSNATSNTLGQIATNNSTQLINGLLTYHFRKVNFISGVTQFRQSIVGTGLTSPGTLTSYYFGISRWFKFF